MDNFIVECTDKLTLIQMEQILDINRENLIINGGTLKKAFPVISTSDLNNNMCKKNFCLVLAKYCDKVVGYTLFNTRNCDDFKKAMYILQIAVDSKFKHKNVASSMYDYIFNHAKGYDYVLAHVNKNNISSLKFHKKMGFEQTDVIELSAESVALLKRVFANKSLDTDSIKTYSFKLEQQDQLTN